MTKREQAALMEIYECLNKMGALSPNNPADIRLLSANLRTCANAAVDLQYALFAVISGDREDAEDRLADAKRRLGMDIPGRANAR